MLWPDQQLTLTFCRGRARRLKQPFGNNLRWAGVCCTHFSNLLGGIRKVDNWLKRAKTKLTPFRWNYRGEGTL